jgi:hypothetical protein
MKNKLLVVLLIINIGAYSQNKISGKSEGHKFTYTPAYERGVPPNLFVAMSFNDENGNGVLECSESAILKLQISNKGTGKAQGLKISVKDSFTDHNLSIANSPEIYFLQPDQTREIEISIKAGFDVKTAEHKLEINVTEQFGYDMDPAFLVLNTLEYQQPKMVFSGYEILDYGDRTGTIVQDGQLQAGEMVRLKLIVQNIGQNVAKNANFKLSTTNPNIYIENGTGKLSDIAIGEVKEFWVTLSPNKRVSSTDKLPIYLSITADHNKGNMDKFQLPLVLNQKPPIAQTLEVKADIDKLSKQVARFEYSSNKFTANVGSVKGITTVEPAKTVRKNSVAVIFGVENYTSLPPAPYADNDAEVIQKYFKDRLGVEQVVMYKNEDVAGFIFDDVFNPDNGALQKAVVKGESDLFVFYSGHGVPSKDGKNIYLFPSDGKIERIGIQGYNINDLYTNLEKLGAKSTTVFIDACFSGSSRTSEKNQTENLIAAKGVKIVPKITSPWQRDPNFSVFNSSGPSETSLGFDPSQTGLFTYYLCLGLQGYADENKDNKITNGELSSFVSRKVKETSKKIFGLQSPQFNGNKDLILVEY